MSLAAGVLTAALALPPQGLVAAYDFARVNFVNWSEDLTQSAWVKTGVNVQAMTGLHPEGMPMYSVVETAVNADHRVDQSFSSIPSGLWFAEVDMKRHGRDVVSFGFGTGPAWAAGLPAFSINLTTGQVSNLFPGAQNSSVSARHIGNGVYRVKFAARQGAAPSGTPTIRCWTGTAAPSTGDGVSGVLLTRAKVSFGTDGEYERTTDAQLLLDRSVRLWPAPAARTNLLSWSEPLLGQAFSKAATITQANFAEGGLTNGWAWSPGAPASLEQGYLGAPVHASTTYNISAYVVMADGLAPVVGATNTTGDFGLVVDSNVATSNITVTQIAGSLYRVSATGVSRAAPVNGHGLIRYPGQSGRAFRATGLQLTPGPAALPYERQTDGVIYDFSLKGRNLLPNSDLTGTAGNAPNGWTVGNAANISYGTDGSVTFTATARFGSMSVHHTGLAVGGRPFTASADLVTTGGGRLLVYLYDHAGTYLTVLSSATVNGRAVIQVNRTDVYRVQFRVEDERMSGWTPITFRQPMLELGLTDGGYQPSARHSTLGSTTGPDSSDPSWVPGGLTFDGVDDSTMAGAFTVPDGDFTFIQVFTPLVDSGSVDGKSLTRSISGAGQWRTTNYLGGVSIAGTSVMGWKVGVYHVTGGFSNSGFTYFNVGQVVAGQARVGVMRTRGLVARADLLASATMPAIGQTQTLPAAPVGGAFGTFGNTANAVLHGYYLWNRSLTDAEITQAYRFIRNQLSRRGITI